MGKMDCAKRWLVVLTVVAVLLGGCATIPELKLLYQLPPPQGSVERTDGLFVHSGCKGWQGYHFGGGE